MSQHHDDHDCDFECECGGFSLPTLGGVAPDFEIETTHGHVRLSDYKGRWVILFSHPADFTPVCTTEFIAFTEIYDELQKRNVDLLGLSVDSVHSHIAWVRNIEEKTGVKIPFPVIADLNKEVSMKYGMIQEGQSDTVTSRCVFFIDPQQKVRAMVYYPLSLGRNMQEFLRVINALQTADEHKVATPANWMPGDAVIVPTPATVEGVEKRMASITPEMELVDWYLLKKKL